ncbi:MAG: hypothetical protein PF489_08875 [Salinivirgaceae bacterium]|jgi:hypothetical protein|nr:hypothetical protein [Salinivirgaceae bacterium]
MKKPEETKKYALKYVTYTNIDTRKWDICINKSFNTLVYAYSWYLDAIAERWDAIIEGDYEAVLPIPLWHIRGKWRIRALSIVPQLGVFSTVPLTHEKTEAFLLAVAEKYKHFQIPLNVMNGQSFHGFKQVIRHTYNKDLIYASDTQHKPVGIATTAGGNGMYVNKGVQLAVIINFLLRVYGGKINSRDILAMRRIVSFSSRSSFGTAYGVYSETNNLEGLGYVLRFHNRVYLLFCVSENEKNAKHIFQLIVGQLYSEYEHQDLVLECCANDSKVFETVLNENGFSKIAYAIVRKKRKLF